MSFLRLDGTVVGNLTSASYEQNKYGTTILRVHGRFDGTNDTTIDCPTLVADKLTEIGAMGEDQGGVWVDSSKRVAIQKTGKGQGNVRWEAFDGNGATTQINQQQQRQPQQQQQRPMTPRPAGASSSPPPQQQQRPTNGQPAQQPRQQPLPPVPAELAEVTRRRIKATMAYCLKEAAEIWAGMGEAGQGLEGSALQATAATIFIAYSQRQIPLLADPQAPPPMTAEQKAALKEFRGICHRLGMVVNGVVQLDFVVSGQAVANQEIDSWFNAEIAKFGHPATLSADQAKRAIDVMAGLIASREAEIEKAKASYVPPIDPPPPTYTGAEIDIPF